MKAICESCTHRYIYKNRQRKKQKSQYLAHHMLLYGHTHTSMFTLQNSRNIIAGTDDLSFCGSQSYPTPQKICSSKWRGEHTSRLFSKISHHLTINFNAPKTLTLLTQVLWNGHWWSLQFCTNVHTPLTFIKMRRKINLINPVEHVTTVMRWRVTKYLIISMKCEYLYKNNVNPGVCTVRIKKKKSHKQEHFQQHNTSILFLVDMQQHELYSWVSAWEMGSYSTDPICKGIHLRPKVQCSKNYKNKT